MLTESEVPRNASATVVLLGVAAEHGLDARTCLAGTGLTPAALERPDVAIDAGQELAVIRNLVYGTHNKPGVGAAAGSRVTLGMLGIWGFALLVSPTARDMLQIAAKYGYRKFSWELMRPRVEGRETIYSLAGVPTDLHDFVIERDLAYTTTLVPMLLGPDAVFLTETTLDRTRGRALAARFRAHEFRFGSTRNAQVLAEHVVDAPLPRADPLAIGACEQQCEELLAARVQRTGVAAAVRSGLLRLGPGRPTLDDLAAERNVDARTLRRHLLAEGTSFRALADEVGQTLATELLAAGLTVEQTADRIGYADAASFTRAFRRWTGSTPGAYTV